MSMIRHDLMELTQEALTALANAGFVKRAFKDISEGRIPEIFVTKEGLIQAVYADGQTASLDAGKTLRDAQCTCPASNLCKHRVTLIPAYQHWVKQQTPADSTETGASQEATESRWSPADIKDDDIEHSFKPSVIKQAKVLMKAQPVIRLLNWQENNPIPSAYLPMSTVRFFSSKNLAHARCDCIDGSGCAHVILAIWAFKQAQALQEPFSEQLVTLGQDDKTSDKKIFSDKSQSCLNAIYGLLVQIWYEGLSQSPIALESKFELAKALSKELKWSWIVENIEDIEQLIHAYHMRSSKFSSDELIKQISFLYARLETAQYAEESDNSIPISQILGIGVAGEASLDHLTLIGLGVELWEDVKSEGASIYFIDPDTATLTVLKREWDKPEEKEATHSILNRRLAGSSLKKLSQSQVITRAAKRRANGSISITANNRQTNVMPLSNQSWKQLTPPIRFNKASNLLCYLQNQAPEFIQNRQAIGKIAVLPVTEVIYWYWDAGTQKLHAILNSVPIVESDEDDKKDSEEDIFSVELSYQTISGFAISNLANALKNQNITEICGIVSIEKNQIKMSPLALTTDKEMVILATKEIDDEKLNTLDQNQYIEEHSIIYNTLQETKILLNQYITNGIRYHTPRMQAQLLDIAKELGGFGLQNCAQQLTKFHHLLIQNDQKAQLNLLSHLNLLLEKLKETV